jgi:hypothetical protein
MMTYFCGVYLYAPQKWHPHDMRHRILKKKGKIEIIWKKPKYLNFLPSNQTTNITQMISK